MWCSPAWCSQAESRSWSYISANLKSCRNMHKRHRIQMIRTGKDEWKRQAHMWRNQIHKNVSTCKRVRRKWNKFEVGYFMSSMCIKMLLINHDFIISFACLENEFFVILIFERALGLGFRRKQNRACPKQQHKITKLLCHFKEKVKWENYDEERSPAFTTAAANLLHTQTWLQWEVR